MESREPRPLNVIAVGAFAGSILTDLGEPLLGLRFRPKPRQLTRARLKIYRNLERARREGQK